MYTGSTNGPTFFSIEDRNNNVQRLLEKQSHSKYREVVTDKELESLKRLVERLEANRPDANRPDANRPDANRPDANRTDANRTDADRTDADLTGARDGAVDKVESIERAKEEARAATLERESNREVIIIEGSTAAAIFPKTI